MLAAMAHRIAFVLFADFQQLDIAGPLAVFEVAERLRPGSYAWRFHASAAGPVRSSAGVTWEAGALPARGRFDTLMLAGGDGSDDAAADERLVRWLQRMARPGPGAPRIASVCSGSLVLAAAGVLDGCRATTHWSRTRQFQARHPRVRLEPDRIYVHDRNRWTSAGITAGIDMALAIVAHDLGEDVARHAAQQLVVYTRRRGGQSQFSALLQLERPQGRFAQLLEDVRARLAEPHSVESLAERACMSPRHFARAFHAETGATPARAVERLRVEAARAALQSGGISVQQAAQRYGFGRAERMRRSFVRLLGVPPTALR